MTENVVFPAAVCLICSAHASPLATGLVMNRHQVRYFRCDVCGFVQTEEPYWLDDAYSNPITASDIGLVSRNIELACITKSVVSMFLNADGCFLDYAGGYGLLVRLMRDAGYNFIWHDRYCTNLFAHGFALTPDDGARVAFDLVTAFEVIEHMRNPVQEMEQMLAYSRNILFTTELLPATVPHPEEWWYYGLDHGQHISFFTLKSLGVMAQKYSLNFYSNGRSVHLFTEKNVSPLLFRLAVQLHYARLFNSMYRRASLQGVDSKALCAITKRQNNA